MSVHERTTQRERRAAVRYVWELSAGIAAFLILFLLLPSWWTTTPGTWPHLMVVLLPIVPLVWVVIALWRHLGNVDEMQRSVLIHSLAFGFAASMLATIAIALLRGEGIPVPGGEWIIFIAGMASWGFAIPVNMMKSSR